MFLHVFAALVLKLLALNMILVNIRTNKTDIASIVIFVQITQLFE